MKPTSTHVSDNSARESGKKRRARLLLTAGEPAGIGPELCLRAATHDLAATLVAVANPGQLQRISDALDLGVTVRIWNEAEHPGGHHAGELPVIPIDYVEAPRAGTPNPENAGALLTALADAVDRCVRGQFDALVTAPMHKAVINNAGLPFTGHTEFIAHQTRVPLPVMMLCSSRLRVALASTHLSLRDVPDYLTAERLRDVLRVLHGDLKRLFSIERPRIVVCGLNPHAGEGGHLGHEEREIIAPVLDELRAHGFDLIGPLPADTAFAKSGNDADAILAMYHDQGLPVIKFADFGNVVNVTLGLPIIRTSVDHGTALDIAGKGVARHDSLLSAIELAGALARQLS